MPRVEDLDLVCRQLVVDGAKDIDQPVVGKILGDDAIALKMVGERRAKTMVEAVAKRHDPEANDQKRRGNCAGQLDVNDLYADDELHDRGR